jgi:Tat protein translocase TatB subunit
MLDIGLQEMLVIGVLALLVFGPSKLPELGRMVGRTMREFRRASDEFRTTVETNLNFNDIDPPPAPTDVAGAETSLPSDLAPRADREAFDTGEATAAAGAATAVAEDHAEPFCAQRNGRIFHRSDCAWVRRIPDLDRVYMKRISDAVDQGYVKCPVCEPWEPV